MRPMLDPSPNDRYGAAMTTYKIHSCPTCSCGDPANVPPEPPEGTWIKDKHGATAMHQKGGGWAPPGFFPTGRWADMWLHRGPLVECGPWGAELD